MIKFNGVAFCLLVMVGNSIFSQKDTIWFDDTWKGVVIDSSISYRVLEHKEIHFKDFYSFTDYDSLGVKLKTGVSLEKYIDKFEGEVIYYADGTFVTERILYRNGAPYGSHKIYYNSGKLKSTKNYDFGVLKGPSKVYYENGSIKESGAYTNNKRNGLWKVYYTNRKLKEQGQYKDGKRVGVWKVFYYNGTSQK